MKKKFIGMFVLVLSLLFVFSFPKNADAAEKIPVTAEEAAQIANGVIPQKLQKKSRSYYYYVPYAVVLQHATHYQTGQVIPYWVKGRYYQVMQTKVAIQSNSIYARLLSQINSWFLDQDLKFYVIEYPKY